jgi:hypothetical protein
MAHCIKFVYHKQRGIKGGTRKIDKKNITGKKKKKKIRKKRKRTDEDERRRRIDRQSKEEQE